MTQDEIIEMAIQGHAGTRDAIRWAINQVLKEHAMREVQRLGQEIEQEPVALPCCGYTDASAVKWNPFNNVVQCHNCGQVYTSPPQRTEQEPVAYDKTEMNCFVQDLYDKKMQEGKHGHYETMFHVVHQAIKRVAPPQRTWVGLNDDEIDYLIHLAYTGDEEFVQTIEAKLKEKNT